MVGRFTGRKVISRGCGNLLLQSKSVFRKSAYPLVIAPLHRVMAAVSYEPFHDFAGGHGILAEHFQQQDGTAGL